MKQLCGQYEKYVCTPPSLKQRIEESKGLLRLWRT